MLSTKRSVSVPSVQLSCGFTRQKICQKDRRRGSQDGVLFYRRRPTDISLSAATQSGSIDKDDVFDVVNVPSVGAVWDGLIKRYNQGGIIVKAGSFMGFCPYTLLDKTRLDAVVRNEEGAIEAKGLLNEPIKAVVVHVEEPLRVTLSEQEYLTSQALEYYNVGDVIKGTVTGIQQYGVFVSIPSNDGVHRGVQALIHVSELSWDFVTRPESIVEMGQEVEAFVKAVKKKQRRIELSLRHDYLDPLKESISTLLPLDGEAYQNMTWNRAESLLPELSVIIEELKNEEGIERVTPERQAEVRHKVSLDLELWLSKEEVEEGFNLVAWFGRTLQEVHIKTGLTRDEMKEILKNVLKRTM